ELFPPTGPAPVELLAAVAFAELAEEQRSARERAATSGDPYSPWDRVDGWRLNEDSHHDFVFVDGEEEHAVRVKFAEAGLRITLSGREHAFSGDALEGSALHIGLD